MSINDPLLKELKSFASCLLRNGGKSVTDNNETLYPFCMCVETVLQRGLSYIHGPFGLIKTPQSWTWLEQIAQRYPGAPYSYVSSVNEVRNSKKVTTPVGKLRLLIRVCLVRKCLHVPVELIVRHHAAAGVYTTGSILSDEIRGEILLSTLMPCSLLNFNLDLDNSSFLDHTWVLPSCITTEFVPCKALGLTLNFVDGRALIMHVKEGSVSAENGLIKTGDILDELNGVHVTNSTRKKLASIMRKSTAKPITVRIIKAFLHEPDIIYPPILTLLLQAHLDPNELVRLHKENALGQSLTKQVSQDAPSPGIPVMYVGAIETGSKGDVKQIMPAIARILKERDCIKKLVVIEILEIGIRVLDEASGIVLQNPSYMEISSCGLTIHFPNYFAYISGEKSCSTAKSFTCHIFYSTNEEQVQTILRCIGQGFQRTHFAV
ncbi:uncharacterized protein LOC126458033 isoform X1 [Schistocerca serialis cubense]|uniref:uncharacterized protein LOC126458033 isoform X1 n=1 Tax=Schistocerca serialis cubense TaxID=2023355 RepID=UPI00214E4AC4|nr:uncharacterized protein LOC126458033 isoform X1 [Schistocerca serialis cubense]